MWSNLLRHSSAMDHLSVLGAEFLTSRIETMEVVQDAQLEAGAPVCQIPLLWRGLAETVGLVVDDCGRIIDGPRATIPGL